MQRVVLSSIASGLIALAIAHISPSRASACPGDKKPKSALDCPDDKKPKSVFELGV